MAIDEAGRYDLTGRIDLLLAAFADAKLEPTWSGAEFTWGFGLKEPHPRGQMNATMMVAEAGSEGAWSRIFNEPNLKKFEQPTVVGVDFPTVGISEAAYDETTRTLRIATDVGDPGAAGRQTAFRIEKPGDAQRARVVCDGSEFPNCWSLPNGDLQIVTDVKAHRFEIRVAAP